MSHSLRVGALPALLALAAGPVLAAPQVVQQSLSFQSSQQSLWNSGDAFQFDWQRFVGLDVNPAAWTINPPAISGSKNLPWPIPDFDYKADPYIQFDADFRLGMNVGAQVGGGSVNSRLDWSVGLQLPEQIVRGQAFSLGAQATRLASSAFQTTAPTASAWVDGILDLYLGGYVRITTSQDLGTHDYRMGNKGFTDKNTSNTPYRTLANVKLSPEIASVNRNGSGQLRVVGVDIGGVGSEFEVGSTTITAGDWRVNPAGSLQGQALRGTDQTTMLTATLDVDQMALSGLPALGTGIQHDWGVIAMDMGYEIVDVKTSLGVGMKQDLTLDSQLLVHLDFSDAVLIDGVEMLSYFGALDALPAMTMLGDRVEVTPTYFVDAELRNQTALTFAAGAALTVLEAHAKMSYDLTYFGTGVRGTVMNQQFGPMYAWDTTVPLGEIGVYDQRFALGGFDAVQGETFILTAVPEPATVALWLAGLAGIAGRRLRAQRAAEAWPPYSS